MQTDEPAQADNLQDPLGKGEWLHLNSEDKIGVLDAGSPTSHSSHSGGPENAATLSQEEDVPPSVLAGWSSMQQQVAKQQRVAESLHEQVAILNAWMEQSRKELSGLLTDVVELRGAVSSQQWSQEEHVNSNRQDTAAVLKSLESVESLCRDTAEMAVKHAHAATSMSLRIGVVEKHVASVSERDCKALRRQADLEGRVQLLEEYINEALKDATQQLQYTLETPRKMKVSCLPSNACEGTGKAYGSPRSPDSVGLRSKGGSLEITRSKNLRCQARRPEPCNLDNGCSSGAENLSADESRVLTSVDSLQSLRFSRNESSDCITSAGHLHAPLKVVKKLNARRTMSPTRTAVEVQPFCPAEVILEGWGKSITDDEGAARGNSLHIAARGLRRCFSQPPQQAGQFAFQPASVETAVPESSAQNVFAIANAAKAAPAQQPVWIAPGTPGTSGKSGTAGMTTPQQSLNMLSKAKASTASRSVDLLRISPVVNAPQYAPLVARGTTTPRIQNRHLHEARPDGSMTHRSWASSSLPTSPQMMVCATPPVARRGSHSSAPLPHSALSRSWNNVKVGSVQATPRSSGCRSP